MSQRPKFTNIILVLSASVQGIIAAWILYLVSFILTDYEQAQKSQHFWMIGFGILAMYPVSLLLRACEVSKNSVTTDDISSFDSVVLFLRGFTTDGFFHDESGFFMGARVLSEEEELAEIFKSLNLGRFVSLAKPSQKYQELGADRINVVTQDWKDTILKLLVKAKVVVMRLGDSDSLLWELGKVVQSGKLYNTLFLVPSASDEKDLRIRYTSLLQKISNQSNYPQFPKELNSRSRFIFFSRKGTIHTLINPKDEKIKVEKLLEPFFTNLGISTNFEKKTRPENLLAKLVTGCVLAYIIVIWILPKLLP